jgi:hypothetical protein
VSDTYHVLTRESRDVERSDEGQYMCQINTARAKTRLGNLHVVGEPSLPQFVLLSLSESFLDLIF